MQNSNMNGLVAHLYRTQLCTFSVFIAVVLSGLGYFLVSVITVVALNVSTVSPKVELPFGISTVPVC